MNGVAQEQFQSLLKLYATLQNLSALQQDSKLVYIPFHELMVSKNLIYSTHLPG